MMLGEVVTTGGVARRPIDVIVPLLLPVFEPVKAHHVHGFGSALPPVVLSHSIGVGGCG
jgi:hypothetical protein